MTNNDILRRVRYTFDYNDAKMQAIFLQAGQEVDQDTLKHWLKKDDDAEFVAMSDRDLAVFLNGLINEKRGKKDGVPAEPEARLTNNIIFMKLKIALNLKSEDVLAVLALANFRLSKHELSAFFRKVGHKHYRECQDQVLRNFLTGLQNQLRPSTEPEPSPETEPNPETDTNV